MTGKGSDAAKQIRAYRYICPPGKLEITIPTRSVILPPSNNYQVIEGRKLYTVWWGLNLPGKNYGVTNVVLVSLLETNSISLPMDL